ncbi:MAG TPA: DUF5522 domain-containing protein [Candidatus Polarisedimenticolia bacterium]|nr:DUF5522 domain-containing protein [Candidatus Polarisedimenticolia bacterium]
MASPPLPCDRIEPHPARLPPGIPHRAEILRRHAEALRAGSPTYADPATGLSVFTARALWDRGWCCDTGCRHCPYIPRPAGPVPPRGGSA